jgi:hypothetical protein
VSNLARGAFVNNSYYNDGFETGQEQLLIIIMGFKNHYYILCLFVKGQTKNLKVLRKKNKKREGFAKEKKSAKFAMPSASQLVAHQSSQIYNEPLIIATLLRDSRQTKLCDLLNACTL